MAYDITIDELFPLRSSFSFKKTASYFCGTCPRLVCRKKLHACILPDSRTFVSPNSISGICSRSTRNFVVPPVSLQSLFMPSPSQKFFFPIFSATLLLLPEATARTFPRPATMLREERGIYIPVVKLLKHRRDGVTPNITGEL